MDGFQKSFLGPFMFPDIINAEPDNDLYFFSDIPIARNKTLSLSNWDEHFKKTNPNFYVNELNSNYFRSDDFKNDHEGLHILFSGCSYTF